MPWEYIINLYDTTLMSIMPLNISKYTVVMFITRGGICSCLLVGFYGIDGTEPRLIM